jgi:hypothetical protein
MKRPLESLERHNASRRRAADFLRFLSDPPLTPRESNILLRAHVPALAPCSPTKAPALPPSRRDNAVAARLEMFGISPRRLAAALLARSVFHPLPLITRRLGVTL